MKQLRIPEKLVQAQIRALLGSVGAAVYTLGTRRPRGDYQGTCQTPGIPDLLAFVPDRRQGVCRLLFIEAKATGGRLSEEQRDFQTHCVNAQVAHIVGDVDAVIAWLIANEYLKADQVPSYRLPKACTS